MTPTVLSRRAGVFGLVIFATGVFVFMEDALRICPPLHPVLDRQEDKLF